CLLTTRSWDKQACKVWQRCR
ncbi:MATE efflux family protein, partial [Vibrio parahaemolyticus V-223/04]